jgi:hypothetical protein
MESKGVVEGFAKDFQQMLPIEISPNNDLISIPNKLKGNVESHIAFEGNIRLKEYQIIDFGRETIKEYNAATMGLNIHGQNAVGIVGASRRGGYDGPRKVYIWELLETTYLNIAQTINCARINVTSDERVKHKKIPLSPKTSLEQVRDLKPVQFEYKDNPVPVHGFIAQEVQAVLPNCVSCRTDYFANICDDATWSNDLLTFKHFNTKDLAYKEKVLYPKLKLKKGYDEQYVTIAKVIDEHTVQLNEVIQEEKEYIVYGQEVDDFLTLDKNQLFTLTTSALQELDFQLQEEKEKNNIVLHRVLQRLSALEGK